MSAWRGACHHGARMGFSRAYRLDVHQPEFQAIWPQLVDDGREVVQAVSARGIRLRDGHGSGDPVLTSERIDVDWPWSGRRVFDVRSCCERRPWRPST
jgi:hypothetical protein